MKEYTSKLDRDLSLLEKRMAKNDYPIDVLIVVDFRPRKPPKYRNQRNNVIFVDFQARKRVA